MAEGKASGRLWLRALWVLVPIGLVLACLGSGLSDLVIFPWARSATGGPVLVGTWKGEVHTSAGEARTIVLTINRPILRDTACRSCPPILGSARLCRPGGPPEEYRVEGGTRDWRGSRLYLDTSPTGDRPPGSSYTALGRLEGEWDGADALHLRVTQSGVVVGPDGSVTITGDSTSPERDQPVDLTRVEADASC